MNIKKTVITAGIFVLVAGGAYGAYDYFAGNHITIQEVIPSNGTVQASSEAVDPTKLNGKWSIQPESKVYFSVTTSKETVNFEGNSVKGNWTINTADPSKMSAEGMVDINSLQSGNSQRDGHVKGANYLNADAFPEAKFTVKTIDNFPKEWKEGAKASFNMTGTLTVKGISKDVTFTSEALYTQGAFNMESSTVVTFEDFGMKNPHTVLLDTQNNVTVQLRLVLKQ